MRALLLAIVLGCSAGGVPAGDLFAEPEVRPWCQHNHPTPYGPCDVDTCDFCADASTAYHNRSAELGCCNVFTCVYRPGSDRGDILDAFEGAHDCVALQVAMHNIGGRDE